MKRIGVISVFQETLVVGYEGGHHVRLRPHVVEIRLSGAAPEHIPWENISSMYLKVPTTKHRHLSKLIGLGIVAIAAVAHQDPEVEADDGTLIIGIHENGTSDASVVNVPLTRHHAGGYWTRAIAANERLLSILIESPAQRELLSAPERIMVVLKRLINS